MTKRKRKNMDCSLGELVIKFAVMMITVSIGLWCGWSDSYGAFYIAVMVQSVNNLHDSFAFFSGYSKFVTVFQLSAFFGALVSLILAILHFTPKGDFVDNRIIVVGVVIALCVPLVHWGIEIYSIIRNDRY